MNMQGWPLETETMKSEECIQFQDLITYTAEINFWTLVSIPTDVAVVLIGFILYGIMFVWAYYVDKFEYQ